MDTKIRKIQTAIFTRNFNIADAVSQAQLLLDINTHSRDIFDAMPVQIPILGDAPQEIPRIVLNTLNNRFNCNVALSRTDVFFNIEEDNTQSLEDLLEIQKNNSRNILDFLISKNVIISRIGFVVTIEKIMSSEDGDCCAYIKNNFIISNKFNEPKELLLRYNKAGNSANFEMNNLITINGKTGDKIIIQTDINTLAESMNAASFNANNFNEIIDYARQKTQELIENFPNI